MVLYIKKFDTESSKSCKLKVNDRKNTDYYGTELHFINVYQVVSSLIPIKLT